MIKINLALRKQPTYVAGSTRGGRGAGDAVTRVLTKLKLDPALAQDFPVVRVALLIAVGVAARFGISYYQDLQLQRVTQELSAVSEQARQLSGYSAKVREAEAVKAALAADTLLIRTKIDTIQKLMSERRQSVNLLLVLSDSVPADVWVTKFRADANSVGIEGRSAGFGQVSDFIRKLSESTYLSDLNMDNTRAEKDTQINSELATFRLTAKRRQP